jgi:hypothetical protein
MVDQSGHVKERGRRETISLGKTCGGRGNCLLAYSAFAYVKYMLLL